MRIRAIFLIPLFALSPATAAEIGVDSNTAPVRGIVKSVHQSTLAAEIQARIIKLPFREGQHFEKGDLLVEFECSKFKADLAAAEADMRGTVAARDNSRSLLKLAAAGAYDVTIAEAQADKSKAAADAARSVVDRCRIVAPYAGRIVDLIVNEYDMPATNGALMRIVDDRNLEVELIAPSTWLRWLKPGTPFSIALDETGTEHPAKISQVGAAVDAVSQTVKLTGVLAESKLEGVLPGMSGTAVFTQRSP